MTTSPDTQDGNELPSSRGPLALILAGLRAPVNQSIVRLSQLAAAGSLNPQQIEHYNDIMRVLQHIARTVEQYAPPVERQAAVVRTPLSERWGAGEQSDAVDDRYQDSHLPLDDRPGHDEQP